jgi:hypothetical protein
METQRNRIRHDATSVSISRRGSRNDSRPRAAREADNYEWRQCSGAALIQEITQSSDESGLSLQRAASYDRSTANATGVQPRWQHAQSVTCDAQPVGMH